MWKICFQGHIPSTTTYALSQILCFCGVGEGSYHLMCKYSSLAAKLYLFCPSGRELQQKNTKVYLVPHFEDCPPGVTVDWEFILWELNGIFFILTLAGLNQCWVNPPHQASLGLVRFSLFVRTVGSSLGNII
jgi:hypothetical protein